MAVDPAGGDERMLVNDVAVGDESERVAQCPVGESSLRELLYGGLTDRVFGTSSGQWDLHRCVGCGAAYLDPPPASHALDAAYETYYTHTAPSIEAEPASLPATVRRALRNGLVNARYGYQLKPATRLAPLLLAGAPGIRGQSERAFRHLPRRGRLRD